MKQLLFALAVTVLYVSLAGLEAPNNLNITVTGSEIVLTWDAVAGADHYKVHRSNEPCASDWGDPLAQVSGLAYSEAADVDRYFYRVTAAGQLPDNFVFVSGGTIYPTEGFYTSGLTVSDFYIDKYELTNVEWNAVMGSGGGDNYPHAYVSWFGAIEYCNRRSMQVGLTPCYSYLTYGTNPDDWPSGWNSTSNNSLNVICDWNALGYRLLSEAEWEYTARGGLQTHGYSYSGSNDLNQVGWYGGNSGLATPVGQLAANELGTYDMSGNLWEWCWDVYSGSDRMLRGGCFGHEGIYCTVSYRNLSYSTYSSINLGFRVCRISP
ncbi:MAG: formylglycine-generating enzyme family protein [Candidatus Cloacimonadaceae bacterium]|jgi:formylglycine-generating enzyme required for sulfatase activity